MRVPWERRGGAGRGPEGWGATRASRRTSALPGPLLAPGGSRAARVRAGTSGNGGAEPSVGVAARELEARAETSRALARERAKGRLLAACASSDRGASGGAQVQSDVAGLVRDLEALNPTDEPCSAGSGAGPSPLSGSWEMVFTSAGAGQPGSHGSQPFRSSPFFWAFREATGAALAEAIFAFTWGLKRPLGAEFGACRQEVRVSPDGTGTIESRVQMSVFADGLAGVVVSTAETEGVGPSKFVSRAKATRVDDSPFPIGAVEVPVGELLPRLASLTGESTGTEVEVEVSYLDDDLRITRLQDALYVYAKVRKPDTSRGEWVSAVQ